MGTTMEFLGGGSPRLSLGLLRARQSVDEGRRFVVVVGFARDMKRCLADYVKKGR